MSILHAIQPLLQPEWEMLALLVLAVLCVGKALDLLRGRRPGARERRHAFHQRDARRVRAKLDELESNAQRLAYLRKIHPLTFEELLLDVAEARGCPIERNERYTGDGGVDGRLEWQGQTVLVQAKRYQNHVRAADVAEFVELVRRSGTQGWFIHTGRTGKGAIEAVRGTPVRIVSGDRLLKWVTEDPTAAVSENAGKAVS